MKRIQIILLTIALALPGALSAQTSKIISGSTNFSVKFIMGTCKGTFDGPKGSAIFDEKKPEASAFDLTVASASFNSGNNTRDKDMKSEKYFFVTKYPEIHFKSSKVEKSGQSYKATGTLTMRDVSKTVTLPFSATKNADGSYKLTGTFEVNRLDYKIGEKDWKLKDVVTVTIDAITK